ncbi:PREDICTED: uncharacterized protein MAL13P1.304-like, partial [Rhagoletis zephyria]|uniref:uncharacterized protein MAL13P1.304-like n=1 Tax=Rhagoletis zephyria TaxID=28612 RepID=UPI00081155B3
EKSISEIMIACLEQDATENEPNVANFKSENLSNSFNKVQNTNFNSQEAFNGNTALDKKNETTLLQTTDEITSITNEQIDLNVTQEIAKPNQTVFDKDAVTNLLPDDSFLSENESSANLSHITNQNIYSENTNSNILKSKTSFHNNASQLPDDGPDKLCTQNSEHSTDQQIVNPNLSADVNTQTKSTKQTNECESNVENLNEEPMGSEHLNKLSNSVTADDQSTVDNCRQIELHLSIDDVKPFIENLNANSTAQIEFPPTESLIFNLSDSSTSVSEVKRNDLTEAENLGHGYLHLNDDVNQVENIDARLDCLENKICNISCQLDAIAEQLIALVPISQTFENLESDKLPQNTNEMPGEKRHITHESSTNKHSISLEFEKVLQKSDLSSSKNAKLLKPNSDKENLEQIFEVPNKVSTKNILLNQLKHEKILPMNEQLTTSSKIENNESSTVFNQNPSPAGSFLTLQDVAEYKNNIESRTKNNSEPLMFNEERNNENQTELQIHQLPPKVIDNQLLKIEHFEENTQESSNIITHLSAKNDKLLPELLTENNNTVSSENKLPDIEKASFEDEKQNLFDIVKENNFEIFSNETLETNCKNEETTNQSYSIDAINTIKQNDEISYLHNYSLSKSHLVNFQSLNTNLKKFNQNTDLKHQSDPITTDNDDLANEISQLPVVCQESSMTVPFPDDLQMNAESNANGAQPLPESTTQNDTFVTEKTDILPPNNLTIAKHINSEQHLPANCKTEETATIDSHQNDLQNNKVIATSRKLNVLSVEKEPLAINLDNESFESINEEQIESLENRISIIAEKLDDIAKNLINIAESQTPSKSKVNELNECYENTSSEKPDLEKLKFEQQIISQHFIQSNHASSNDENEISQQLEHFDLNEAKDCFTKCISDFYSNSTAQPNSELSKEQTRTLLVQPELQTYASSTIKSDCTEADSVEQPSLTTEVQSSNTEQTETCIQNNDESSMQECLTVVNDKQPLNDFNVNNEDTRSCGQTDSNDCATEQRQAGYPSGEIETLFGQINNEAHNSLFSKTVTTPESLLPAENINEVDMKNDADFIGQPTMETGHSNNLMTYADAVKLSKAGCKVKSEERDSPNVSNLSTQTLSSQISTDELPNSPKNSDHSESSLTDMNRVTCDDDALLEYIETRVDVLDSKISNLTEWFREYCNASKRPEHSEHLIWPKLDMLTIEPASESFEQINQTHSIASEKSDCKENDDSSVEQISGNSISRSNSLSTYDRNVNKDDAFQQNNVCSTDLPAEQENPPAETLHREQDASSAGNIFDAELDEIIDNELGPASDENAPLDTKIDSPTETYELNHSELPTLTPNELQSNALPPNCLSEKSNELEQSVNPNYQQKAKEASLEIDSPKEASTEINSSAEKRTKTLIQQPELEQQSSLLHDTQVHDSSTSISTGENLINATLQTDKSSETEQNELGTSTSSMFDEQGRGDASSSVSRENCFTDAQDFKESFERKPRFISDFKQPVLASALRPDFLPDMLPIEDVGMECQQPKDTVSEMSPTTEAVTNNPSETSENIPLIDLTSELSPADDSLSVSFNKSALQDVSVGQNVESKVLDSFSKKSKLNVTIKTKQANSSRLLESEQQFSSNADIPSTVAPTNDIKEIAFENADAHLSDNKNIPSTVAPTNDIKEIAFENADAHLSDNKSAKNANETFNSEFCNQNSGAAEMVSPGSPILAGEYLADSESVPHEDDDLIAAKCHLNDTDGGIGKEERPLDVRQLSVGDTTDTVRNLSTVPAIDRADIGQAAASVSPQSAIPDSQLMQSKSSSTSRDNIFNEPAESQPRPSLPREQPNRPPSGNFFSRNFGRVARYSLPCYLLPLLLLLILLIFPHSESDFNCLMQFDEYRSGIMKTYQDGPPPV